MLKNIKIFSYKGISQPIEINFEDEKISFVLLIGDGGKNKTSALQALRAVLTGDSDSSAVNNETGKAHVEAEFSKNGRSWKSVFTKTRKTETLTLSLKDENFGFLKKGGKDAIRELVGEIWIDPFELQKQKPAKQIEKYREWSKIDTKSFDERIESLEEERKKVGHIRDDLSGYINQSGEMQDPEANAKLYAEEKPISELLAKQQSIQKDINLVNAAIDKKVEQSQRKIRANTEINRINDLILAEKARIEAADTAIEKIDAEIFGINTEESTKELAAVNLEIAGLQDYNTKRNNFLVTYEKYKEWLVKESDYKERTKTIVAEREKREKYIADHKLNIEGLDINAEKGMVLNDIPVSALSDTEVVNLVMNIQRIINSSSLPVMIIDESQNYGSDFIKQIDRIAESVPGIKIFMSVMNRDEKTLKIELRDKL